MNVAGISLLFCSFMVGIVYGQGCNTQADCASSPGMRCQYRAGQGFRLACEVKPRSVNKQCTCRQGCLQCNGGPYGYSRFLEPGVAVKTGCGRNRAECRNSITNDIFVTFATCDGVPVWESHCTRSSPAPGVCESLVNVTTAYRRPMKGRTSY